MRAWRAAHPGHARKSSSRRRALQEQSPTQPADIHTQSDTLTAPALQEVSLAQTLVLTGLIAHLTGAALQEDIALTSRRLQQLALDIVAGDPDGRETIAVPAPQAPNPRAVQLARPPLGYPWIDFDWPATASPGDGRPSLDALLEGLGETVPARVRTVLRAGTAGLHVMADGPYLACTWRWGKLLPGSCALGV